MKLHLLFLLQSALGATALGQVIYVCGGYDGVTSLSSVEKYCPQGDTWTKVIPMNKSRSAGAVIAFQGTFMFTSSPYVTTYNQD